MSETIVIPQDMTTVKDHPGDISSPSPQEVTTFQDNVSTDTAGSLQMDSSIRLPISIVLPFQIVICSLSLFGNLLLTWVLNHLPNSKLRSTTKILMRYVSLSHCLMSVSLIGRLVSMPCFIVLLGAMSSGFNVQCGSAYLGYEILVMVTKPYSHQKFISMNICKVGILTSCLVSVCFSVVAYLTMKEPDDPSCHFTNGGFNPVSLCFYMGFLGVLIIVTSTMQIFTLKAMKRVFPGTGNLNVNVIHVAPANINVIHVAPVNINVIQLVPVNINVIQDAPVNNTSTSATPGQNFPLQKLTKMLTCSLLCSVICWFPSVISIFTFSIFEMLRIEVGNERQILFALSNLVALNGILYVIVYLTMSSQIRQAVKKYLSSWVCQGPRLFGTFCAKCDP